jgi:ATP-binding cassette, subfamily B, bacterial
MAGQVGAAAARRAPARDLGPLVRLLPYLGRRRADLALAGLFLLLAAAATLALPAAARQLVDGGFASANPSRVNAGFGLLVAVAVAMAVFSASRFYFVTKLGERVVADLKADLYGRMVNLPPQFYARVRTGEALSRLTVDATLVDTLVATSASVALRNGVMLLGGLGMMLATSPRLTGLTLLIIPAVLVPILTLGRQVRTLSAKAQDRVAEAGAEASETLDSLETVQAFSQEERARARFAAAIETGFAAALARVRARSVMTAIAITIVFGGIVLVLWEGARAVMDGAMTPGALTQFVLLAMLTGSGAGALAEVWGDVQKAAGATARMFEILDAAPAIAAPPAGSTLAASAPQGRFQPAGRLEFQSVGFRYPALAGSDGPPPVALADISFAIEPGETVAIVGPSGAGKSTLFRLALRLFDPQEGRVLLDGVDARALDPKVWRRAFASVSQNPDLFSGTALENIAFGAEGASPDEIALAARRAEAEPFIQGRLGGYDRPVGDRGRALSGGERQRLAIARALVRAAPVLLLDEATSALDAENERLVQKAFDEAMAGRTTLVIAHRLATVLRADRILVMDQGRIVEQGRHPDLVAAGGLYAHLASLQFAQQ